MTSSLFRPLPATARSPEGAWHGWNGVSLLGRTMWARMIQRYEATRADDEDRLVGRMRRLAEKRPRYGYRRIWAMLRPRGHTNTSWEYPYYKTLDRVSIVDHIVRDRW
jgi:hypothetical protein